MNKKGFTLIELLAVIVILAVIALIATPAVLNVIEDSKKAAAEASARNIVDAAKTYYMKSVMENNTVKNVDLSTDTLKYDGSHAEKGKLVYSKDGKVSGKMYISGYCITALENGTISSEKVDISSCDMKMITFISREEYNANVAETIGKKILYLDGVEDTTKYYELSDGTELYYSSKYNAYVCFVDDDMTSVEASNSLKEVSGKTPTSIDYSGDINGDGRVSPNDAMIINDTIHNQRKVSTPYLMIFKMDVTGDKTLSIEDVRWVINNTN